VLQLRGEVLLPTPVSGGFMPPRKAEGIQLASLTRSVEAAFKIAAARNKLVNRWEIIGRRLRDVTDMNVAYQMASDVTRGVKLPGMKLDPVITRIGKDILIGFVERGRLPMIVPR
jgi:hypothetical protein